jgi:RNA polymerase sigma-70 factor (ECF subfamily)
VHHDVSHAIDPNPSSGHFQTTSWTLLARAGSDRAALATLVGAYWSPIYAWLRRRGHDRDQAAELTQAFVSSVLLERDMMSRADPARGRFRSFIITALQHFLTDEHRRSRGRGGARPQVLVPSDPAILEVVEPDASDDPARAFDRQWAVTALSLAIERLEQACRRDGLDRHWRAFEARVLQPALHGIDPPALAEIAAEIGADSPESVSPLIHTVKRKFRSALRSVIEETVDHPADVDVELDELRRLLVR